jgi:drug/metabolite transporter (DMT)-like permease
MRRFEKQLENLPTQGNSFQQADAALQTIVEELQIIQQTVLKSLQDELKQLQAEKMRLSEEVKRLQQQKEDLLQSRQISEIQGLLPQLAQVLASHISSQLQSSLESLVTEAMEASKQADSSKSALAKNANQILDSLDDSLTITFHALQQELKNYQSTLSQQLAQMSTQQKQGEEILTQLVNRLRGELEKTTPQEESLTCKLAKQQQQDSLESVTKLQLDTAEPTVIQTSLSSELAPALPAPRQKLLKQFSQPSAVKQPLPSRLTKITLVSATGICLLLLSTLLSSLYNIAIKVIFAPGIEILGAFEAEQLLPPSLGNILLILMLRTLVVVPMILVFAPILHPQVWEDLQDLVGGSASKKPNTANDSSKRVLLLSIVSGCFLFLSQVLIYIAISQIATGMAIALLFIYPAISGLLAWFLFRDRPGLFRKSAIACILGGQVLVLAGSSTFPAKVVTFGSTTAIASGIAFAIYVILTRICAAKLHPVSFTLINFATMLGLSLLGLLLSLPINGGLQLQSSNFLELILSAFILGVFTLFGYLFNHISIRKLGPSHAAVFGATVPVLTVILAGLIIQESLQIVQIFGVLLVTGGAIAFSYEKMRNFMKASQTT